MALIDKTGVRHDVPHEPGEWIEVRQLTAFELDEAEDTRQSKVVEQFADKMEQLKSITGGSPDDKETIEQRRTSYDPLVLLKYGIQTWSYKPPVSRTNIELLDSVTRNWLWNLIVEENTRPPAPKPGGDSALSRESSRLSLAASDV